MYRINNDDLLNGIYTIFEIAKDLNKNVKDILLIQEYNDEIQLESILEIVPEITELKKNFDWYVIEGKKVLGIPVYVYKLWKEYRIVYNDLNFDIEPDEERLENWEYVNPMIFSIKPNEGFEFCEKIYKNAWNVFLSGSARMNFYEGKEIKLEQRIKYAIIEYMLKRKQYYNEEDFTYNEILDRKKGE